jgi:hypothetical protein
MEKPVRLEYRFVGADVADTEELGSVFLAERMAELGVWSDTKGGEVVVVVAAVVD